MAKNQFRCNFCKKEHFRREYIRVDHIDPVGQEPRIEEATGLWFPSWDVYIKRLYCPLDNLQALCLDCHDVKTQAENQMKKALAVSMKASA